MKKTLKKTFKDNKVTIIGIGISFLILLFKEIISTYTSSVLTLIPSIFIFIWFLIRFFNKKINIHIYDVFFGLMLLVGTISGIINSQKIIAIVYQIKALSIFYLLFMIIRDINLKQSEVKNILKLLNVVTVILILFSVIEVLFEKNILFPSQWASEIVFADNYIRAYSLICNPNVYGFYLIFILIYNYKFGNIDFNAKNILFYSLIILGIILSISRSALISLIIIGIIYFIKLLIDKKKKKNIINSLKLLIITIVLASCFSFVTYKINSFYNNYKNNEIIDNDSEHIGNPGNHHPNHGENINDNKNETFLTRIVSMYNIKFLNDSLKNGRLAVINYGISVLQNNNIIIGTGFSSFLTASSFINPNLEAEKLELSYADNQYIAILVETGILGFVLCTIFVIIFLINLIRLKKYESIVITFVFLFFGLFINVLEVQLIAFLYFLFLSLDKGCIHEQD